MPTLPFTYPSGVSIAVTFTDQTSGMVWRIDTSALEAFTVANVANYGVVPAETPASSGRYPVASPAGLPVGWYKIDYYIIAGSSLASGDLSSWIGGNVTYFDGTSFYSDPSAVAIRQEMDANSTKLANLDATVSSRSTYAGGAVASVTAPVAISLTTAVPTTNTANSLGDCLNAARAQGFGKWTKAGTVLTLFASDGTTIVRTFTLDDATSPTSRS